MPACGTPTIVRPDRSGTPIGSRQNVVGSTYPTRALWAGAPRTSRAQRRLRGTHRLQIQPVAATLNYALVAAIGACRSAKPGRQASSAAASPQAAANISHRPATARLPVISIRKVLIAGVNPPNSAVARL
jgi:hypothetical protein